MCTRHVLGGGGMTYDLDVRDVGVEIADLQAVVETQALINETGLSLADVMRIVAERTQALTAATGAVVELAEGDDMVYRAATGSASGALGLRLRRAASLSGLCVATGQVLRCEDTEVDPRVDRDACRRVRARSMVVVPLTHRGATVGVLKVLSAAPGHFDDRDVHALQLMGGFIAASLSNARRYEELSRLNEALDDFSAHVAHDLHNPIFVMAMAGAELRRSLTDAPPEVAELVSVIEQQVEHSRDLVSSLLHLARASRTPSRVSFDLGELVDEAARGIGGIALENDCHGTVVVADRVAVRQAVANLLTNGARYAAAAGVAVMTVHCEASAAGWRVLVADRGPGLGATERERAFSPFERGQGSAGVAGSGLGLAIVAAVAQAHGGDAGYEPRGGGGSVFWLSLLRKG